MAFTRVLGPGIHTASNINSHNINSTGIITAVSFVGDGSSLTGIANTDFIVGTAITMGTANFTGNVTIGGTLTYEDVKNVDSVGVITAREAIDLPTDKKILLGDNDKFTIYKSSSPAHAIIENAYSAGSYLRIGSANGVIIGSPISHNQSMIRGYVNGRAELYYAGSEKIRTTEKGIQVGTGVTIETNGQATYTGIITATAFKLADGSAIGAGAGGTWSSYTAGIATSKSVGVNTSNLDDNDLVGVGNSFQGLYISNGMLIHDNTLNGNHYIGTSMNGLMAGPVNIEGTLTIDGNYVVV